MNPRQWARLLVLPMVAAATLLFTPGVSEAIGTYNWTSAIGSTCSTKLTTANSKGQVVESGDHVHATVSTLQVTQSLNEANYLSCKTDSGITVHKMSLTNNYTMSGVRIDNCSVGFPSGFNCAISGSSSVLTDASASTCTNCSHLDADQYGISVSWQTGAITHYIHAAKTVFTGSNGSTITLTATIDQAP